MKRGMIMTLTVEAQVDRNRQFAGLYAVRSQGFEGPALCLQLQDMSS